MPSITHMEPPTKEKVMLACYATCATSRIVLPCVGGGFPRRGLYCNSPSLSLTHAPTHVRYRLTRSRYTNVRIDAVHYCELEIELAAKRKRRSFFDRNGDPVDAPQVRLELFMRSVRGSRISRQPQGLERMVLSLRLPYMTRETNKENIARTITVLPNLRFVDLPQGLFSDEPSYMPLKKELQMKCPELRRMSYKKGAEGSFSHLPGSNPWRHLEVLELSGLQMELPPLRHGLAAFPRLRELTLDGLSWFDDSAFTVNVPLPPFPAVRSLTIRDAPHITANGLAEMLSNPANSDSLETLTLSSTGVTPWELHKILAAAPKLHTLSINQEISSTFPVEYTPPLASMSLTRMHYELTSEPTNYTPKSAACYTYLISSLVGRSLPYLLNLYVRDATFPDQLWQVPEQAIFAAGEYGPRARCGLLQSLHVYSKGMDEMEWNFTAYEPCSSAPGRRSMAGRPVSFNEASLWGSGAGKNSLDGNRSGGFLAVPSGDGRHKSRSQKRLSHQEDLWR